MKNGEQEKSLFGISLSSRPKWQQFLLCTSGFFFGYLVNGICESRVSFMLLSLDPLLERIHPAIGTLILQPMVCSCLCASLLTLVLPRLLQEYVYNRLGFSYGWYFTFVQCFVYLFLIHLQGFRVKHMVNTWKTYVKLSAVLMGSHGLTKGSLAYLNYPAQLMFKSTKVLPVMIMGAFIPGLRRKYPFHEYVSAVLLVIGLILFTLADANTSPNFSIIGVIMVSAALVMDAFLGNLQEAIFRVNPETTQTEMLFCSTVVGMPFLLASMILTGELFRAWKSCSQHPYVYGVLVFEAMATFVGQVSVLSLIAFFGAATTAMITTARKAVTLLLSYIIFTKPLTEQHGTGLLLIGMGITLKMLPDSVTFPERRKLVKLPTLEKENTTGGEEDEENKKLMSTV